MAIYHNYKLNELSGTTVTDLVGGKNMTATGTTIVDGKENKARNFVSSSDYVSGYASGTLTVGESFSLSILVNINTAPSSGVAQVICNNYPSASNASWVFQYQNDGGVYKIRFYLEATGRSNPDLFATITLTPGKWYLVEIKYDGSATKIFVDGIEKATASTSGDYGSNNGTSLVLGRFAPANSTRPLNARLDNLKIGTKNTPAESKNLYLQTNGFF